MALINKIYQSGKLILPATIIEAVKSGTTGESLTDIIDLLSGGVHAGAGVKLISGTAPVDANVAYSYQIGTSNTYISIPKDSSLADVYLGTDADALVSDSDTAHTTGEGKSSLNFIYLLNTGKYKMEKVDVSKFLEESEFGAGLAVDSNGKVSVNLEDADGFLTITSGKIQLSGVQAAIDSATSGLISSEISTVSGAIATVADDLSDEIARAEGVDAALSGLIDTLSGIVDGLVKDTTVADDLSDEIDRAKGVEGELSGAIVTTNGRIDTLSGTVNTVSGAVADVADDLSGEIARAENVEGELSGSIDTLNSTVINNYNTLSGAIDALGQVYLTCEAVSDVDYKNGDAEIW